MDISAFEAQIGAVRLAGETPDRLAKAVVDGSGRLLDLTVEPALLRRPAKEVGKAILVAVTRAQGAARVQGAEHLATLERQIEVDVAEANQEAERRLAELETFLSDLIRGRERAR